MTRFAILCASALLLMPAACDKEAPTGEGGGTQPAKAAKANDKDKDEDKDRVGEPSAKPASDHGQEVPIGEVKVAGYTLEVSRLGTIAAGSDAAVALKVLSAPDGKDWRETNLYVWVEGKGGKLNAPEKANVEEGRLHAHASIPKTKTDAPTALVLRVREGETDERVRVSLTGADEDEGGDEAQGHEGEKRHAHGEGHSHGDSPHDGVLAKLVGSEGEPAGFIELKLHDDKGDLELWLMRDAELSQPFDVPLDATIDVTFTG